MLSSGMIKRAACSNSEPRGREMCSRQILEWLCVRLSWLENAYLRPLLRRAILTRKVAQTDLVFGMRSGFISRTVQYSPNFQLWPESVWWTFFSVEISIPEIQNCMVSRFMPPWLTSTHTDSILISLYVKLNQLSFNKTLAGGEVIFEPSHIKLILLILRVYARHYSSTPTSGGIKRAGGPLIPFPSLMSHPLLCPSLSFLSLLPSSRNRPLKYS